MRRLLCNKNYSLRGRNTGLTINGTSDGNGIVFHVPVPEDIFEITCQDTVEVVEVNYIEHIDKYGILPCKIKIR
jgi:hypothetical protein